MLYAIWWYASHFVDWSPCVRPGCRSGDLRKILAAYEPPPIPVHIVHPAGRYLPPKLRLFIDEAVSALRAKFGAAAS